MSRYINEVEKNAREFADNLEGIFNSMWDEFLEINKHPYPNHKGSVPFDVYETPNGETVYEFAVAGFDPAKLEVSLDSEKLVVKGTFDSVDDSTVAKWHTRKISRKNFEYHFGMPANAIAKSQTYKNGVLTIVLDFGKQKAPKKLDINIKK